MSKKSINITLVVVGALMVIVSNIVSGVWLENLQDEEAALQGRIDVIKDSITSAYNNYALAEQTENHTVTLKLLGEVSQNDAVKRETNIAMRASNGRSIMYRRFSMGGRGPKNLEFRHEMPDTVQTTGVAPPDTVIHRHAMAHAATPVPAPVEEPALTSGDSLVIAAFNASINDLTDNRKQLSAQMNIYDTKILRVKYILLIVQLAGIILILIKDLLSGD